MLVLVHGGAGRVEAGRLEAHVAGCGVAADAGLEALRAGGSALDAAQRAVEVMEDDPQYNAGTGGSLRSDGSLQLDASIMDGATLEAGAVCALRPFAHPIAIARKVMESRHVLLAAEGAEAFAREAGFEPREDMITERAKRRLAAWRRGRVGEGWAGGTVGAVAVDAAGHVAAATSTGGTVGAMPGRVGDSPIVGAGTWADDQSAACSATGLGEGILRVVLAKDACDRVAAGADPQAAVEAALARLEDRVDGSAGLILVAPDGRVGIATLTETMSHALARDGAATITGS